MDNSYLLLSNDIGDGLIYIYKMDYDGNLQWKYQVGVNRHDGYPIKHIVEYRVIDDGIYIFHKKDKLSYSITILNFHGNIVNEKYYMHKEEDNGVIIDLDKSDDFIYLALNNSINDNIVIYNAIDINLQLYSEKQFLLKGEKVNVLNLYNSDLYYTEQKDGLFNLMSINIENSKVTDRFSFNTRIKEFSFYKDNLYLLHKNKGYTFKNNSYLNVLNLELNINSKIIDDNMSGYFIQNFTVNNDGLILLYTRPIKYADGFNYPIYSDYTIKMLKDDGKVNIIKEFRNDSISGSAIIRDKLLYTVGYDLKPKNILIEELDY